MTLKGFTRHTIDSNETKPDFVCEWFTFIIVLNCPDPQSRWQQLLAKKIN